MMNSGFREDLLLRRPSSNDTYFFRNVRGKDEVDGIVQYEGGACSECGVLLLVLVTVYYDESRLCFDLRINYAGCVPEVPGQTT